MENNSKKLSRTYVRTYIQTHTLVVHHVDSSVGRLRVGVRHGWMDGF